MTEFVEGNRLTVVVWNIHHRRYEELRVLVQGVDAPGGASTHQE